MKLIFVYNADSGLMNTLIDIGHKAISPTTYQCRLCDLTFGLVGEHKQWKKFREESNTEMEFLHRDEFEQQYAQKFEREGCRGSVGISNHAVDYPVILLEDNELTVMISQTELNEISTKRAVDFKGQGFDCLKVYQERLILFHPTLTFNFPMLS